MAGIKRRRDFRNEESADAADADVQVRAQREDGP